MADCGQCDVYLILIYLYQIISFGYLLYTYCLWIVIFQAMYTIMGSEMLLIVHNILNLDIWFNSLLIYYVYNSLYIFLSLIDIDDMVTVLRLVFIGNIEKQLDQKFAKLYTSNKLSNIELKARPLIPFTENFPAI